MRSIPMLACTLLTIFALSSLATADEPSLVKKDQPDIWQKLDQKVDIQFDGTPLDQAVKTLSERYGLNIILDRPTLDNKRISKEEPVTFKAQNVKLLMAINLLLTQTTTPVELELVVMEEGNYQLLTTIYKAEEIVITKVYPFKDLIDEYEPQELITVIETTVRPEAWESVGGFGTIIDFRRALVIRQTPALHREIQLLLDELMTLPKVERSESSKSFFPNELYQKIIQETELHFVDTPLIDAINIISELHDVNFQLAEDVKTKHSNSPVSIFLSGITVRTGLDLILEPLELGYTFKDNLIFITEAKKAKQVMIQEIYNVEWLGQEPEELSVIITSVVDPDSWQACGGPGAIHTSTERLAISQNLQNHLKIESLLQKLNKNSFMGFQNFGIFGNPRPGIGFSSIESPGTISDSTKDLGKSDSE